MAYSIPVLRDRKSHFEDLFCNSWPREQAILSYRNRGQLCEGRMCSQATCRVRVVRSGVVQTLLTTMQMVCQVDNQATPEFDREQSFKQSVCLIGSTLYRAYKIKPSIRTSCSRQLIKAVCWLHKNNLFVTTAFGCSAAPSTCHSAS